MSSFKIEEKDFGSKRRAKEAIKRVHRQRVPAIRRNTKAYLRALRDMAKQICTTYGAVRTGRLRESIRIVRKLPSQPYTVAYGGRRAQYTGHVVAGGKIIKGKMVNYAQIVHDGGPSGNRKGYIRARPFLKDAYYTVRVDKYLDDMVSEITQGWGGS